MNKLFLILKIGMLLVSCNSNSQVKNTKSLQGISIRQSMKIRISGKERQDSFLSRVDIYAVSNAILYDDYFDFFNIGNDSLSKKTFHDFFVQNKEDKYGYFFEHCNPSFDTCITKQPQKMLADSFIQMQWFKQVRLDVLPESSGLKRIYFNNKRDTLHKSYAINQRSSDTLVTGEMSLIYVTNFQMPIAYTIQNELDTVIGMKLSKIEVKVEIQHLQNNSVWNKESEVLFYLALQEIFKKNPEELLPYLKNKQN